MKYRQIPAALHALGAEFIAGPNPMDYGWHACQLLVALHRFDLHWVVLDFDECSTLPPLPMPSDLVNWFVRFGRSLPELWSRYRISVGSVGSVRLVFCVSQRPLCTVHARDDRGVLYEVGVRRPVAIHAREPLERAAASYPHIELPVLRRYAERQRALAGNEAEMTGVEGWIVRV